ncbi:ComEC/Rec2 family competence protein [Candidatus Saccharibacteria bacterium]|nr:ComEC/Rec2 family competence protein [Candidatus Saccharibacteria bacterium]
MKSHRAWWLRRTNAIMVLCAMVLFGLLVARLHLIIPAWFVVAAGIIALIGVKKPAFRLVWIGIFGFSLGLWRGASYLQAMQPYQTFARQKVTLQARVSLDAVYGDKKQLTFEVKKIQFTSPRQVQAPGTIKVSGFGELAIYRGDIVEISGKLYPTRGGKQATMSFAEIKRIGSQQTWVDTFRRSFVAGMQTALPEPQASFGLGILIGQRNTLPFAVSQAFLMVGLTHIVAVSGYNLTILLDAARKILAKRSKHITTTVGVSLMTFFLLITGASPSIVRAAVVSGLGLAAWYYGRSVRPMVLILLAAALTAYATPVFLWSDIGWWLSVLAFFGILVVAPQLKKVLFKERNVPVLASMAIDTLCAELMTIPLIMYIFGQVSLVGLLANMLVAACIPIAMLLSFIAAMAGMLTPTFAGWFAWPAKLLLTYMIDTATMISRIPHIFQQNAYLGVVDMGICYGAIVTVTLLLYRRRKVWFSAIRSKQALIG